ncbi:hypothetical protein [Haloferula sp. BvORR071]|uniref:hypothetical protein n=1 Tax=Haloferula sp. BvORR071 TaxID=1396141 RepID=UPI000551A5F0|nr:hypothetical protein [Haloferula sp. BvORR071]
MSRLLVPVRGARSAAERMRATVDLARNLPLSDVKEWYAKGWFGMPGAIEAEAFLRIIRDRWIAAQPQEAMTFLLTRDSRGVSAGMKEWARLDPAAALDFVSGNKDPRQSNNMLWAIVQSLGPETDPALIMAALPKLSGASFYIQVLRPLIALAAGKLPPEQLAAQSATWPAELKRAVQGVLDGAAFLRDPSALMASFSGMGEEEGMLRLFAALDASVENSEAILSRIDKWPQTWLKDVLSHRSAWVINRDPQRWLKEDLTSLGLDDRAVWRVRVSALGKLDPESALAALKEIQEGTAEERRYFVASLLQNLASKDFAKAESLLASLSDPLDVEAGRKRLDLVTKTQAKQNESAIPTLDQRIDRLFAGEFGGTDSRESMENWSVAEGAAAVNNFRRLTPERKDELAKKMADRHFQGLQSVFQGELISWILANPPPLAEVRVFPPPLVVESVPLVAFNWSNEDPIAASHWAQSLPAGADRNQALATVAQKWAESEPAAVRKWLTTLPEEDRAAVETLVKGSW